MWEGDPNDIPCRNKQDNIILNTSLDTLPMIHDLTSTNIPTTLEFETDNRGSYKLILVKEFSKVEQSKNCFIFILMSLNMKTKAHTGWLQKAESFYLYPGLYLLACNLNSKCSITISPLLEDPKKMEKEFWTSKLLTSSTIPTILEFTPKFFFEQVGNTRIRFSDELGNGILNAGGAITVPIILGEEPNGSFSIFRFNPTNIKKRLSAKGKSYIYFTFPYKDDLEVITEIEKKSTSTYEELGLYDLYTEYIENKK